MYTFFAYICAGTDLINLARERIILSYKYDWNFKCVIITVFGVPDVTLSGWQDVKMQLLTIHVNRVYLVHHTCDNNYL